MAKWKVEEIEAKTSSMFEKLVATAKEDAKISEDEKAIIDHIEKMLWDVESEIELVIENESIDDLGFQEELGKMLVEILDKAEAIANEDGEISDDEKSLLQKIRDIISGEGLSRLL